MNGQMEDLERIRKTYLRYEEKNKYGVIAYHACNTIQVFMFQGRQFILSGGVQEVLLLDGLSSTFLAKLKVPFDKYTHLNDYSSLCCFSFLEQTKCLLAGYESGEIYQYDLTKLLEQSRSSTTIRSMLPKNNLSAHGKAIRAICFNWNGSLAASGSKDTTVIVWDVLSSKGAYKLSGHNNSVTTVLFVKLDSNIEYLLSGSKDAVVKVWDLDSQYCLKTVTGFRSEVLSIASLRWHDNKSIILVNSRDSTVRAVRLDHELEFSLMNGGITRKTKDFVMNVRISPNLKFIIFQTKGKCLEVYRVRSGAEIELRKKKKNRDLLWTDWIDFFCLVRTKDSIKAIDFGNIFSDRFELVVSLKNNAIEFHQVLLEESLLSKRKKSTLLKKTVFVNTNKIRAVHLNGHRGDIHCCSLSSEKNLLLLTADSKGEMKLWNAIQGNVISMGTLKGTNEERYVLCCSFAPGSEYFLVGTKVGAIIIFSTTSMHEVFRIQAHEEGTPLWCIDISVSCQCFVSGGSDKTVRFWDFDLDESNSRLEIVHTRTLKVSEEVIDVRLSNTLSIEKQILCVALTDNTVKVFDYQSLKFKLSLYGHKLPVTSMDISDDDTLIVTGSADKNIKIWGLDFGDCHRSIFAHDLPITGVKFISKTHQFVSISKDKTLKFWDADNFTSITTIYAHCQEILCFDILCNKYKLNANLSDYAEGDLIITISGSKQIKAFARTNDIVFPNEEKEKLLLMNFDADYEQANLNFMSNIMDKTLNTNNIPGLKLLNYEKEANLLNTTSTAIDLLKSEKHMGKNEKLIQAMSFFSSETDSHDILRVYKLSKEQYLFKVLGEMSLSELPRVFLFVTLSDSTELISLLHTIFHSENTGFSLDRYLEKVLNILILIVKYNFSQLKNTNDLDMQKKLSELVSLVRDRLQRYQQLIGKNICGQRILHRHLQVQNLSVD